MGAPHDDRGTRIRTLLAGGERAAAGELAQAWTHAAPESAEAHNALGTVHAACGDFAAAAASFRRATELDTTLAKAFSNLGGALRSLGDLPAATASLHRAVELDASNPRAWSNLGNALRQAGRTREAVAAYERASSLRPSAATHAQLGALYAELGQLDEAADALSASLRLEPAGPASIATRDALLEVLLSSDATERAHAVIDASAASASGLARVSLARAALQLSGPARAAEILTGIGPDGDAAGPYWAVAARIAEAAGDLAAAEAAAVRAARAAPATSAWCEVARLRTRRRDPRGAAEALAQAEAVDPASPSLAIQVGDAALLRNDVSTAEHAFRRAALLAPRSPEPVGSLAMLALRRGDAETALLLQRDALALDPAHAIAHRNLLLTLQYRHHPHEELLRAALAFGRRHAPVPPPVTFPRRPEEERRLRLGYLSADLRAHAVARFVEDLVAHHDRSRFELFFYDASGRRDRVTERLARHGDTWRDVHTVDDRRLARTIREDAIDVLVDLNGHSAGSRLQVLGMRPAPVLLSFLGYPDTTGIAAIDARITDADADPRGIADRHATEELIRLDRCAWCFTPEDDAPDVTVRPPDAPVVFGVFNNVAKITEQARASFAEVLRRVPGSRLVFKGRTLDDPETRARFLAAFDEAGVADRVELRAWTLEHHAHLASYADVDVQLDSFPYAGTTTTCESLWMGVPVVTLAGDRHAGRVGVSLLRAVGLDDLVAHDRDDFVARAAALAGDRARLARLRADLRERMRLSPLRDGASYARALEAAYEGRFADWRAFATATRGAPDVWLPLADGAVVSIPDDLARDDRVALEEHGDGRDLSFLRAVLDVGDVAADVGAGVGVHALAMAKRVGSTGRVIAIEASPLEAVHLRRSAARAPALRVVDESSAGASDRDPLGEGSAPRLDDHAGALAGVRLVRVDASAPPVLAGARRLVEAEDPIWMWRLPRRGARDAALLDALEANAPHLVAMRWVEPLGALVPLDPHGPLDDAWTWFFTLSPRRRDELEQSGRAARDVERSIEVEREPVGAVSRHAAAIASSTATGRHARMLAGRVDARQRLDEGWSPDRAFDLARFAHECGFDGEVDRLLGDVLARAERGEALRWAGGLAPLPAQDLRIAGIAPEARVEAIALEGRIRLGAPSSPELWETRRAWLARLADLGALPADLAPMRDVVERHASRLTRR